MSATTQTRLEERTIQTAKKLGYSFDLQGLCMGISYAAMLAGVQDAEHFYFFYRLLNLINGPNESLDKILTTQDSKADEGKKESLDLKEEKSSNEKKENETPSILTKSYTDQELKEELRKLFYRVMVAQLVIGCGADHEINYYESSLLKILPEELKKRGGAKTVCVISGVYFSKDLERYLSSLRKCLESFDGQFSLIFGTLNHAISVTYIKDKKNNQEYWAIINPSFGIYLYLMTDREAANTIINTLNPGANVNTTYYALESALYTTGNSVSDCKKLLEK